MTTTKNRGSSTTAPDTLNKTSTVLLDDPLTVEELELLEEMRSSFNIARAVLRNRMFRRLTQEHLARLAGTKQSRVSEVETATGDHRLSTIDRIARVLGLMVALVPRGDYDPCWPRNVSLEGFTNAAELSLGALISSSGAPYRHSREWTTLPEWA